MTCSVNHATLNLKFCPACGVSVSRETQTPQIQPQQTQCVPPVVQHNLASPQSFPRQNQPTTNTFAIVGFISSLTCCSPLGIVFSAISLNQLNKNPGQGGKGLATAGLIVGIAGLVFGVFYFLIYGLASTSGY